MSERLDKDALRLARARIKLGLSGATGRTAARINGFRAVKLDDAVLCAFADPDERRRIATCAAAIHHAAEISQAISSAARAQIAQIIPNDIRQCALRHRGLSTYEAAGTQLAERFADTLAQIDGLLEARIKGAAPSEDALNACLDAALSDLPALQVAA